MAKYIDVFNENRWIKFISTVFAFISPFIPFSNVKINEIINTKIQLTLTSMDIVSLIVAGITSLFLVIIVRMFFYVLKKYSEMEKLHENMKDETIIIKACNQIYLENLPIQLTGLTVISKEQRIQQENDKLLKKLQLIYPNLPEWKVKEKLNKFLLIYPQQEKL